MEGECVGILTDTHDNKWAIQAIVEQFQAEGVTQVIHAGDYVAPFNARYFSGLVDTFVGVFGNNDGERVGLTSAFSKIGKLYVGPHVVKAHGRRLLVMHEPTVLDAVGRSGDFDAVVYGHTHVLDIRTIPHAAGTGQTLVINPGEACGWLHDQATAVLLDLESLAHEVIEVPLHP